MREKQLEQGKDKMELFLSVDGLNDPGKTLRKYLNPESARGELRLRL